MINKPPLLSVTIYLRGQQLIPEHVSAVLGINPSDSQKKGELHITSTNHHVIRKIGLWSLAAQNESNDVTEQIEELMKKIGQSSVPLNKIEGVDEAYIDIFIAINSNNETVEFELGEILLKEIARLGLLVRTTLTSCDD